VSGGLDNEHYRDESTQLDVIINLNCIKQELREQGTPSSLID